MTWKFIICFRTYRFNEISKGISASQRLECSLDVFFLFGILLGNSLITAVEVCLV